MLRILAVILLVLCVLAMPSYAAIMCGSACAGTSEARLYDCCASVAIASGDANEDADGPRDSNHSDGNPDQPCAAPCCGFVAHVLTSSIAHDEERPLADLLPSASALSGAVSQGAIFHPPRA